MSTDSAVRRLSGGPWIPGRNLICRPVDSLSLYVHIPFCTSRCRYCNFYFETGWSPAILRRTLDTILAESLAFRGWLFPQSPAKPPAIHTVYFGGGTPSVIPPAMLDDFLERFRDIWGIPVPDGDAEADEAGRRPAEFAFEANPETMSPQLMEVLGRQGIDRLSLGIQSFSSPALRRLGRRASRAEVEAALATVAEARRSGRWRGRLNLDLISGIPGQTPADTREDLARVLEAAPDHVSLYSLTEEEGTPLAQGYAAGLWPRPAPEAVEEQLDTLARGLENAGLHNYEISNFARPGCESRHNLAYWELRPYLGLGPGAVGTLPVLLGDHADRSSAGRPAIARLTNPSSMAYSRPSRSHWEHQAEILSNRDFLADHFVVGLRTGQGADTGRLERIFHLPPGRLSGLFAPLVKQWRERGLLAEPQQEAARSTSHHLALNPAGRALLNPLLVDVLEALDPLGAELDALPCPDWP